MHKLIGQPYVANGGKLVLRLFAQVIFVQHKNYYGVALQEIEGLI